MSHKTSDCLIEVVAKAGLTVYLSVGTPEEHVPELFLANLIL